MKKRAIAPLVATLLLISFAIALGVVIMNFGRAQVELEAECAVDINLKFSKINDIDEICYDTTNKNIKFTTQNGVNIDVNGLIINVIGSEKAETFEKNDAKITKANTYSGDIAYDTSTSGKIRQIKITPKVILLNQEEICVEKALVVEEIRDC